jgi:two-component system chemotaxis sensor kinase CheA
MSDRLDVGEFIAGYLAEAEEHLGSARGRLLTIDEALRKGESSPKAVRELFRSLHTLKGLSAMVGAEPIVDIAHELETILRVADKRGGKLPANAVDEVLKGLRAIEERVASLGRGETLAPAPKELIDALAGLELDSKPDRPSGQLALPADLLARLSLAEQEQLLQGLARGRRAVRADFLPSQTLAARDVNITSVRERLGKLGDIVKVIPRGASSGEGRAGSVAFVLLVVTDATNEAIAEAAATSPEEIADIAFLPGPGDLSDELLAPDAPGDGGEPSRERFVRVEISRLDDALEGLSALVVTRSRLERAIAELGAGRGSVRDLRNILGENGRQLKALRGAIMRARMVPVADVLDRAPLLVRALSRSSRKLVRLTIDGGNSELDKAVGDRLFPAIIHLLRNAVDHAIETPAERRALGKPEEGQIRVSCGDRSASQLRLVVSDDGRGIDRARVAAQAHSPVPEDDVALLALITRPGLSTIEKATHTSGRGLGMDIVKRIVVDELGGELELSTRPGAGTEFTVVVPLSVTILDVFSFVTGGRTFVVPVGTIDDLTEVAPEMVTRPPGGGGDGGARLLNHRGAVLPLFNLASLLGCPATVAERPKAIIVRRDAERFAFQVDRMLGQQEVVVRPVRDPLVNVRGVAGSTDLGDGQPTLVLDLASLMERSTAAARGGLVS